jgi:hypothetical protein
MKIVARSDTEFMVFKNWQRILMEDDEATEIISALGLGPNCSSDHFSSLLWEAVNEELAHDEFLDKPILSLKQEARNKR